MDRAGCLKRHLLHASVEAYHPAPPFYSGPARWTDGRVPIPTEPAAQRFLGLARPEIDFALVGRFSEGIVVAFRGTLPPLDLDPDIRRIVRPDIRGLPVPADWWNNLDAPPVRNVAIGPATLPGAVHRGFAASLARLWERVAAEVDRLRGTEAAPRLYFTGHSKGGALANLAAACARQAWPDATVKATTFGAARPGDRDFAQAYRDAGIDCHRYEVVGDRVPEVAPWSESVGTLHRLAAVPHRPPSRSVAFVRGLFGRRDERWLIPPPIAAHLPYPSFGYGDHVCEAGCRHDWL